MAPSLSVSVPSLVPSAWVLSSGAPSSPVSSTVPSSAPPWPSASAAIRPSRLRPSSTSTRTSTRTRHSSPAATPVSPETASRAARHPLQAPPARAPYFSRRLRRQVIATVPWPTTATRPSSPPDSTLLRPLHLWATATATRSACRTSVRCRDSRVVVA